jgi:hypothetical protein
MQPRNPFQGQAPSNMQFPTDAYIRGVTNAANIQAEAQARMGQQIGEGLQKAGSAIGSAYMQNAGAKADYSATQSMLKSPTYQKLLGLDESSAGELSKTLADVQGQGGYGAANKQSESLLKYLFQTNQATQEMNARRDLMNAQIQGAFDRAKLKDKDEPLPTLPRDLTSGIDSFFGGRPAAPAAPQTSQTSYGTQSNSGVAAFAPDIQEMMNARR